MSPKRLTLVGSPTRQASGIDAALLHMVDQRAGAVNRGAFFVAGDDQADRACVRRNLVQSGNKGRDAALHIDRAAPVQQVAANFGHERVAVPAIAGRNDIDMAGKGEMAALCFTDREQIFDRRAMRRIVVAFARNEPLDGETQRQEHRLKRVEHCAGRGRDAFAGD